MSLNNNPTNKQQTSLYLPVCRRDFVLFTRKKKQRKIESSDKVAREAIDLQRHNLASSDITNEKSNKDAGTMGLLLHFFLSVSFSP
jgi:hypothetical protein